MSVETTKSEVISLKEIINLLFKRKILILIITMITTTVLIGLSLLFNLQVERIEFDFTIMFEEKENHILPSGTKFYINEYITLSEIEDIIASNDKFQRLNANQIAGNVRIDVDEVINYTLSFRLRDFGSSSLASSFADVIFQNIGKDVFLSTDSIIFNNDLDSFILEDSLDFDVILSRIEEMKNEIITIYENLIANSTIMLTYEGITLRESLDELTRFFIIHPLNRAITLVRQGRFVRTQSIVDTLEERLRLEETKLADNQEQITNLINIMNSMPSNNLHVYVLNGLVETNLEINQNIRVINDLLENGAIIPNQTEHADFLRVFYSYLEVITIHTNRVNMFNVNQMNDQILYFIAEQHNISGGFSLPLVVISGLILGFVISTTVAIILETKKGNVK